MNEQTKQFLEEVMSTVHQTYHYLASSLECDVMHVDVYEVLRCAKANRAHRVALWRVPLPLGEDYQIKNFIPQVKGSELVDYVILGDQSKNDARDVSYFRARLNAHRRSIGPAVVTARVIYPVTHSAPVVTGGEPVEYYFSPGLEDYL